MSPHGCYLPLSKRSSRSPFLPAGIVSEFPETILTVWQAGSCPFLRLFLNLPAPVSVCQSVTSVLPTTYLQEASDLSHPGAPPRTHTPAASCSAVWAGEQPLFGTPLQGLVQKKKKQQISQYVGQFGIYGFKECPAGFHVSKHFPQVFIESL